MDAADSEKLRASLEQRLPDADIKRLMSAAKKRLESIFDPKRQRDTRGSDRAKP
jgi:hypothetical protein